MDYDCCVGVCFDDFVEIVDCVMLCGECEWFVGLVGVVGVE